MFISKDWKWVEMSCVSIHDFEKLCLQCSDGDCILKLSHPVIHSKGEWNISRRGFCGNCILEWLVGGGRHTTPILPRVYQVILIPSLCTWRIIHRTTKKNQWVKAIFVTDYFDQECGLKSCLLPTQRRMRWDPSGLPYCQVPLRRGVQNKSMLEVLIQ